MPLTDYYNRFDPANNHDEWLFRAGKVLQSAELNEIQGLMANKIKSVADVLMNDGSIVSGGEVILNSDTGVTTVQGAAIYIRGAVRGVPQATFTIPVVGTVVIGVYITETIVTELEDETLRDPALGVRNYQEPGAGRRMLVLTWGFDGDGQAGDGVEFYPIYTVVDGNLETRNPPPEVDAVASAIAAYDRQSTGSDYVSRGMKVIQADDLVGGEQVYTIQDGEARVAGKLVSLPFGLRVVYPAAPDIKNIVGEPRVSEGPASHRIDVDRPPIAAIQQVRITKETTSTITHGAFVGALDPIPNPSVVAIVEVVQGGTTYVQGVDYKLTSGQVDWSLGGDEPSPGSSYDCTYHHITTQAPTDVDESGFNIENAVDGTLIQTDYQTKLPRYDRLCLDSAGQVVWLNGVAQDFNPLPPEVPAGILLLATIYQPWIDGQRRLRTDGVKLVPMSTIEGHGRQLANLFDLIAQHQLLIDANAREPASKRGLFVDAFQSSAQRDAGLPQECISFNGELSLPIAVEIKDPGTPLTVAQTLAYTISFALAQTLRTGPMLVNPYGAFDPLPSTVVLNPAVDKFVEYRDTVIETQRLTIFQVARAFGFTFTTFEDLEARTGLLGARGRIGRDNLELISETTIDQPFMRAIDVKFTLTKFGPGEDLTAVIFDGIDVTASVAAV